MPRGFIPILAQDAGDLGFVVKFNVEIKEPFAQLRYPRVAIVEGNFMYLMCLTYNAGLVYIMQ